MSGTSTVYDVKVRYALDDKAKKGVEGIGVAADKSANKASSLKGALMALGGAAVLGKAKDFFIDFNSEIEQMKIGMTTILNMQLKTPWADARKEADGLFKTFQQLAKASPATTKDFMEMATAISPMVALAGGGTDKIAKLSAGAVTAGLATGTRADVAANDVKQMLAGTLGVKDLMANQLLGSQGIDTKTFNAMSAKDRAKKTEELLDQPALKKAADEFGKTFAGETSTFKDQLQIALGEVGMPLMQQMTSEVKRWNDWITKHPATIAKIQATLSGMLKDSFTFIKDSVGWLVEHRETIMSIAKVFLVFKGTQMATGLISNFARGISDFVSGLKNNTSAMTGAFGASGEGGSGFLGGIAKVGKGFLGLLPAIGALTAVLFEAGSWIKDNVLHLGEQNRKKNQASTAKDIEEFANSHDDLTQLIKENATAFSNKDKEAAMAKFSDPNVIGPMLRNLSGVRQVSKQDFISRGLNAAMPKTASNLTLADYESGGSRRSGYDIARGLEGFLGSGVINAQDLKGESLDTAKHMLDALVAIQSYMDPMKREEIWRAAFDPAYQPIVTDKGWGGGNTKPEVNVTIQKVEVASEDPDRFVFGLVQIAHDAVKHSTQSKNAIAGGF